jgi:nucleoside-diphosphate-sugar epimerase
VTRVLVTGASGFVGAHAVDALLAGSHEVHAVARRGGAPRDGVVWHEADLLERGAAERLTAAAKASALLHLAWYAVPGSFWAAAENERWIDASLRLLRAFGAAGGRRAVMAGTCAEYRWGVDVLRERDTPSGPATALEPATLYGACKHATHIAATAVAEQLDVSLAWGRIFFLYGPGEPTGRLVSSVVQSLLAGEEVATTDGHQRRDFLHVADVAGAFATLLDSPLTGALNIASGEPVPVRDIVELIEQAAGVPGGVRFGALPTRPDEPDVIAGDAQRMREELGFRPIIGLEQGLAETVAWWRSGAVRGSRVGSLGKGG